MKNEKNVWSGVTLEEYSAIRGILADGREMEDKLVSLAAILQGTDEETILTMPLTEVSQIFEMVQGLAQKPKANRICNAYTIGEWKLRVLEGQMCLAQWIDFQNYARDGIDDHLEDILSVVLIPEGRKYNDGYDLVKLKADLKMMTVGDALAVCFFFQRKYLRSIRRILTFWAGWSSLKGKKGRKLRRHCLDLRREVSDMLASL